MLTFGQYLQGSILVVVGEMLALWWALVVFRWLGAVWAFFLRRPSDLEMSALKVVWHCRRLMPILAVFIVVVCMYPWARTYWPLMIAFLAVLALLWRLSIIMAIHVRRTFPYASGGPVRKTS
jgi:hypothetical protein